MAPSRSPFASYLVVTAALAALVKAQDVPVCRFGYASPGSEASSPVEFGTPGQKLTVKLSERRGTWVTAVPEECTAQGSDCDRTKNGGYFDYTTSSTWNLTVTIQDTETVPGNISQINGMDTLSWYGLIIPDFSIALTNDVDTFPTLSVRNVALGYSTVNQDAASGFSIYYGGDSNADSPGEILFGHVDQAKYYEPMAFANLSYVLDKAGRTVDTSQLKIPGSVIVNGERLAKGREGIWSSLGARLIGTIDLFDNYLHLNRFTAEYIYNATNAEQQGDKYLCDCKYANEDITLELLFGIYYEEYTPIIIPGSEFILKTTDAEGNVPKLTNGTDGCEVFVKALPSSQKAELNYILGAPFVRSAYIWFDYGNGETGVARKVANAGDSKPVLVPKDGGIRAIPAEAASSSLPPPWGSKTMPWVTELPTETGTPGPTNPPASTTTDGTTSRPDQTTALTTAATGAAATPVLLAHGAMGGLAVAVGAAHLLF